VGLFFGKKKKEKFRVEKMSSSDRNEAIKRLERERLKINAEIEGVLENYAKESGNRHLRRGASKRGNRPNDWDFEA
jgi:ATP-dependent Lon protease